jgi:hypothetical protein
MLPRMQLSLELCKMYRTKIAASRNKQMLLEQMDMDTIKDALCGTGGNSKSLSTVAMETIRSSIRNRPKPQDTFYSLDAFIEEELLLARENERMENETNRSNRFMAPARNHRTSIAKLKVSSSMDDIRGKSVKKVVIKKR